MSATRGAVRAPRSALRAHPFVAAFTVAYILGFVVLCLRRGIGEIWIYAAVLSILMALVA